MMGRTPKGVWRAKTKEVHMNVYVFRSGEEQRGGTNAMFAVAVDSAEAGISKDRYIIGGEEFANTYIEA